MQAFSKENKGIKYLLTVIDIFSKYAWAVPLKNKTGESVTDAFNKIVSGKALNPEGGVSGKALNPEGGVSSKERIPQNLWVDEGKEFYNKTFQSFLNKNKINMYHTFNQGKAVVIERFNRSLKRIMWKYFTANNTYTYLNDLQSMVDKYNNTKHSSIKMTPNQASKQPNKGAVYFNLYGDLKVSKSKPKFKIGDRVRLSKIKRHFEKGYTPNWTEEIFIIDGIQNTNPITYTIRDLNNELVQGSFYEQELLSTKQEVYRIEKVIRRDYKKKQALVKWKGYSGRFNSWIPFSDLKQV
tara:strand:+ start:327 stop:1214 length:888 start_codon:yes stop_codon:yes gene_type:complete